MNNEPVAIMKIEYFRGSKAMTNIHLEHCDPDLPEGNYPLYTHPVKELTDRIAELENALQSIDLYLSDTLSGRAGPDPSTYKQWLIDGVIEGRNRARAILRKVQEK